MEATGFNHVSINAIDLEESVSFYVTVLGLERIPTYNFAFPTQYLRLGDLQLHIFERPTSAPAYHHIGINVDDFEAVFLRVRELDLLDTGAFFSSIYELPDGSVQLYIRDPAGNLIELDWPDVTTLDPAVFGELPKLADSVPQSEEGLRATLYLPRERTGR
ncbi:MAG TPA: VOC family protein [Solirubrobacterales bacterium]|nr:VOC family protein [Solirubrobacterales bacterium]